MRRTTIMVPEDTYQALKRIAQERGERLSDVVRAALRTFVDGRGEPSRRFTFVGRGASGRGDLSLRAEEVLGEELEKEHR